MRLIKYLVLLVIALVLVTVALGNRDPMTLRLMPDELARLAGVNFETTLPIFVVILGTFLLGLFFGFVWEWIRESKQRSIAKVEHRELERLEKEVKKASPPAKSGDDILAILDGN